MLYVLEELEFTIGAFGEDGGAEGLHDLLDRDGGGGQLVFCRTGDGVRDKTCRSGLRRTIRGQMRLYEYGEHGG